MADSLNSNFKTPLFSVIIPTCFRELLVRKCLKCLEGQNLSRNLTLTEGCEVIISNDAADGLEGSLSLDFPWVNCIAGPRRGPAANRNVAASFASGRWLIFTDDDCLPDPNWIKAYQDAIFHNPQCFVFEGRTLPDREFRRYDEAAPVNVSGGYLWSCNMCIRRDLFEEVGGFDETFPFAFGEDTEFRTRLNKMGIPITFVPDAVVVHPVRRVKGLSFLFKEQASMQKLHELHPDRWPLSPVGEVKNVLRRAKRIVRNFPKYRGRGLYFEGVRLYASLIFIVRMMLGRGANFIGKCKKS